ncbi:50S ribosomal protein L29 [Candidatus Acetothermia bacterium]|jgi:large subunit ribosomal protein L29|nr:MAG: 50S ribosomal protein L29 [Candidatus Acetothermia bacterium]
MRARELRELSPEELDQKLRDLKRKLLNLRFQLASGQLQNTAEIGKTKRDIARVLTVIREREREGRHA